jgi:hypothetical protein
VTARRQYFDDDACEKPGFSREFRHVISGATQSCLCAYRVSAALQQQQRDMVFLRKPDQAEQAHLSADSGKEIDANYM